jgi:hypothetical protein
MAYSQCYWNMKKAGIETPLASDVLACQQTRAAEIMADDRADRQERAQREERDRERRAATWRAVGDSLSQPRPQPQPQPVNCTSTAIGATVYTQCQ